MGYTKNQILKRATFSLGTIVKVTVISDDPTRGEKATKLAFDELKRVEGLLSKFREDSAVSRINQLAGSREVEAGSEVLAIIKEAINYSKCTDGAFDITIGPLMSGWGFVEGEGQIPTEEELKAKLAPVGYHNIVIDEKGQFIKFKHPGTQIDLGAIGKGYAVDKAVQVLKEHGVKSAMVDAGGDILVLGVPPDDDGWAIGIQHPRQPEEIIMVLKLKDRAIATAGDYERAFVNGNKMYCHIMNPRVGQPANDVLSASVIAKTAAEADALSTAVFVLGARRGIELIDSLNGVEGLIVTTKGKGEQEMELVASKGLKDYVEF